MNGTMSEVVSGENITGGDSDAAADNVVDADTAAGNGGTTGAATAIARKQTIVDEEWDCFVVRDEPTGALRELSPAAVELFHLRDFCNDEGYPVNFGTDWSSSDKEQDRNWDFRYTMYCGRDLGTDIIPDSDGCCRPNNGPNCPSCQRFEANPNTRLAALRRLFPSLWWWQPDTSSTETEEDKKMQQLFPELWQLRSTSAGMSGAPSCDSILVGALRQSSGRFYEAIKLLQEDGGLTKFKCPDESGFSLLSEPQTDLPPPHESMSEQALQQADAGRLASGSRIRIECIG